MGTLVGYQLQEDHSLHLVSAGLVRSITLHAQELPHGIDRVLKRYTVEQYEQHPLRYDEDSHSFIED